MQNGGSRQVTHETRQTDDVILTGPSKGAAPVASTVATLRTDITRVEYGEHTQSTQTPVAGVQAPVGEVVRSIACFPANTELLHVPLCAQDPLPFLG